MAEHGKQTGDDRLEVHSDSEGNQWIEMDALSRSPQVLSDLTRLYEGFAAEQKYRRSLTPASDIRVEEEVNEKEESPLRVRLGEESASDKGRLREEGS